MSQEKPVYRVRTFDPINLTDFMSRNQVRQFLREMAAVKENGRGCVMVVFSNGHVRWLLSGRLEDFELPEEYK